jgi:hypothetical protein
MAKRAELWAGKVFGPKLYRTLISHGALRAGLVGILLTGWLDWESCERRIPCRLVLRGVPSIVGLEIYLVCRRYPWV